MNHSDHRASDAKMRSVLFSAPHPPPRDEWLVGSGQHERNYLIHLTTPRFIARIVCCNQLGDPEPGEEPVDLSGIVYSTEVDDEGYRTIICQTQLIDFADPQEILELLKDGAKACWAINGLRL